MRRFLRVFADLTIIPVFVLFAALGCKIGVFYEMQPQVTVYSCPPPAPVTWPDMQQLWAEPLQTQPLSKEATAAKEQNGGRMDNMTSDKRLAGQYVMNFEISGCPAGTGYTAPFDVMRGWLENALQGSSLPIGQTPTVNQNGQQQFNNQTTATSAAPKP